jgi:hypothetical protein
MLCASQGVAGAQKPSDDASLVHELRRTCENLDKYPSGKLEDFRSGLRGRIGLPHLEYEKAMYREHCKDTGCDMQFTTRNYNVSTTPAAEWDAVVEDRANYALKNPQNMSHVKEGKKIERLIPDYNEKIKSDTAKKACLRKEEVIAVILYTGPMYYVYSAILTRYERPIFDKTADSIFRTLDGANGHPKNLYSTTLTVLVSAVQKLSTVTVFKPDVKLYRGTGGEQGLPDHFWDNDCFGCKGMTDWGYFSSTPLFDEAQSYSGMHDNPPKPCPIIFEIETDCINNGACVVEFSQYAHEGEYMFTPCSFITQVTTFDVLCGALLTRVTRCPAARIDKKRRRNNHCSCSHSHKQSFDSRSTSVDQDGAAHHLFRISHQRALRSTRMRRDRV